MEHTTELGRVALRRGGGADRVKFVVLAVPTAAMVVGAAAMVVDLRLGLLTTAFILGWTQLVGL